MCKTIFIQGPLQTKKRMFSHFRQFAMSRLSKIEPHRILPNFNSIVRAPSFLLTLSAGHKTSSTASKRFIKTGNGGLKYAHAGKKHLNRCKGKVRLTSLGARGHLQGTWLKKMKRIL